MTTTIDDSTIDDIAAELQALIDAEAAATGGAGAVLRVEVPAHGFVWRHAAGGITCGGPAVTPTTPFRIASITKTFTAAVIVQLAAEGRLGFDDLMAAHLPPGYDDLVERLQVIDGVSYGPTIRVRQLLTHQAGLFDYASAAGFFGAIAAEPARVWTPREMLEGSIEWGPPHAPPGQGYPYNYSDTGYVLLGLIIEHLDGRPLHEAYRARILDPLGMHRTYLEGHEAHRGSEMSHPYEGDLDCAVIHGTADWAGGGLVSDVDDIARFAQALTRGEVVPSAWLDEMFEWRFRTLDPERHSPGYLGYGFGVEARDIDGLLLRGHRGHWGAWMHVHPASGLTISGTINQAQRPPHQVVIEVTRTILRAGLVEAS
jgi:D-alanyl-D-alanine carboxypeptidase